MKPRITALALSSLLALTGCGGGSGTGNSLNPNGDRNDPNSGRSVAYTITDLGAVGYNGYWYGYAGKIKGTARMGTIRINAQGKVVTSTGNRAATWENGVYTSLGDNWYSLAYGINATGQVAGYTNVQDPYWRQIATVWSGSDVAHLGTLSNVTWSYSQAYAINDAQGIAGDSTFVSNEGFYGTHAFLFQSSYTPNMTDLGTLGGNYSHAEAINNAGHVVGWSSVGSGYYGYPVRAFVWRNGAITDLGTLSGGMVSDASDINDAGQVVGSSDSPPVGLYGYRAVRAVVWESGAIRDLGTLGGPSSIAFGISAAGEIVGAADTNTVDIEATLSPYRYYWFGGGNIGGGAGGASGSVGGGGGGAGGGNNGGSNPGTGGTNPIVGGAGAGLEAPSGRSVGRTRGVGDLYVAHAFLHRNGTMVDLNTLIPGDAGWELTQAHSINARGQIVGFGTFNNRTHAYLLTPIAQ